MKAKRWQQKAVDRKELARVIKEVKAVRQPYRQGASKYIHSLFVILQPGIS
jgi:hypothetical protein